MERSTFYVKKEKTWYTSLLFKEEPTHLPTNEGGAKAILYKVEKKAIEDGHVNIINAAYKEMLDGNFAEVVPPDEHHLDQGLCHYLQCHPVYKLDKDTTTKCRIVMNGSARRKGSCALNDILYIGPCLLPDGLMVLIRFRIHFISFVLDISRMFLRIKLHKHKDFLRFVWRNCDQSIDPEIWRMISVSFGIISSPFQAIFVVKKHAKLFEQLYNLAQKSIDKNIYMDDVADGSTTSEKAKKLIMQLYHLLLEASMTPHKFASNDPEILQDIPKELHNPHTCIKVLGLQWDTLTDELLFNFVEKMENVPEDTKRTFLQTAAKIYDPLGLISPLTTTIKILFQQVWIRNIQWDESLPTDISKEWSTWKEEVRLVANLKKPRCFFNKSKGEPVKCDLFGFGDASIKAYATAIYLRATYADGTHSSSLVRSVTRVTPVKLINEEKQYETIVRLELMAALITARALEYVRKALDNVLIISNSYSFTDSLINLWRIKNGPDRYKVWVAGRIKEILTTSDKTNWFHCPGVYNPADLPSRGVTADELINSQIWWNGPDFMLDYSLWPKQAPPKVSGDIEEKKLYEPLKFMVSMENGSQLTKIVNRFSSWPKTIKLLAMCLRFGLPAQKHFRRQEYCTEEQQQTEIFLWRKAQQMAFGKEFLQLKNGERIDKASKIRDFNPTFDQERQLILSESRLLQSSLPEETSRPIILPKNCKIVEKYIMHIHQQNNHVGPEHTFALIRQHFALCQGRRQVKKIVRQCRKTKCVEPRQLGQQMAPLPSLRTDDAAAFRNVAVDLFGPLYAKHWCKFQSCPHPEESKVYGALFTCFHSRAVHLELIRDQGTEEFLAAFRCFVGRRGTPNHMFSDNARNFKCADKEIRSLYKSINWETVKTEGLQKNINWTFNTEKAPWANGISERMVRSVKTPLRIIIGNAKLTYRQMMVILTECEGIINNRPLAMVTNDPDDLTPITPAELVVGRRLDQLPDPNIRQNVTNIQHLWRKRQAVLNGFWKRWSHDYLLAQNCRRKWHNPTNEELKNRVVIIRDDNLSRHDWKVGRILDTVLSKDGLVRTVIVKTPTSVLRRPIQRIALLENVF